MHKLATRLTLFISFKFLGSICRWMYVWDLWFCFWNTGPPFIN